MNKFFRNKDSYSSKWQHLAVCELQISVANRVHKIVFWEHTLLCFQLNFILKNGDDKELILYK